MTNAARGYYYSGETSSALKAVLTLSGHEFVVTDSSGRIVANKAVHETQFTDRVGTVPRRLMFSDGTSFETPDNDCIDGWLASVGRPRSFVFRLERQLRYVLPSVILAAGILWGMVSFGVPAMATYVARVLPADALDSLGESTLVALDQFVFEPTTLAPVRQREVQNLISEKFAATETDGYEVVFRGGGDLGANAVALPDGTIVLTDELLHLLVSDEEIVAVCAHEIGHLVGRHSMRHILQAASVTALSYFLIGDATETVQELLSVAPAVLISSSFSRQFEREADSHAVALLQKAGVSVSHLATALQRLSESSAAGEGPAYLASHPPTDERIDAIRATLQH